MSSDISHVQWAQRSDAFRSENVRVFDDVFNVIDGTFRAYSKITEVLGPYNAKQMGRDFPYVPPTKEYIMNSVKRAPRGLSEFIFNAMVMSSVKFCTVHKGKKQLATPHPSTHHSAHFPDGTFKISYLTTNLPKIYKNQNQNFSAKMLAEIKVDGINNPIYVENLKERNYKYLIIRPKLGKLGTASAIHWEALFYTQNFGFLIDHCDSNLNPRYSGII